MKNANQFTQKTFASRDAYAYKKSMRYLVCLTFIIATVIALPSYAKEVPSAFRATSYPLPRFVSLRSDEVYVRTGPGAKFPVQWVFKKDGLPLEVILEYDNWRKIRDYEGATGWVHQSLISGKRTALTLGEVNVSLHRKSDENSKVMAELEPTVLIDIEQCAKAWCFANASGYKGWIKKSSLWGVYEDEKFD